jgi:hypothetical protein
MNASPVQNARHALARYDEVRAHTERLAAPLSAEDQTVQPGRSALSDRDAPMQPRTVTAHTERPGLPGVASEP